MAQTRVQVGRLNAPTQSDLRPQASPVETYVRPPETKQQPSQLSQFLTAITPAIEADADLRNADRLKREREIETGQRRIHASQLDQQAKIIEAELDKDWTVNRQEYLQMSTADVLQKRRDFVTDELDKLKSTDIDPMLLDEFAVNMEALTNVWGKTTYEPAKVKENKKINLSTLGTSIIGQVNLSESAFTDKDNPDKNAYQTGAEQVNTLVNNFMAAYGDNFTKQEINDHLMDIAFKMRETNPDSALVAWLDSPLSKNQMNVDRNIDKATAIRNQKEKASNLSKTAQRNAYKANRYSDLANGWFEGASGTLPTGREETIPDGEGTTWTPSDIDMANYVDEQFNVRMIKSQQKVQAVLDDDTLSETEKQARIAAINTNEVIPTQTRYYQFYTATGETPVDVVQAAQTFNGTLVTQNVLDPLNAQNLAASYEAMDRFTKFGGNLSTLEPDTKERFLAVQALVDNSIMDVTTALSHVQGIDKFDATIDVTTDSVKDAIDGGFKGIFKFTDKEDAHNLDYLRNDAQELAQVFRKIMPQKTDEQIIQMAVDKVSANFMEVKSPDGSVSLVKQSKLSKRTPAYVENLEQGLEDITKNPQLVRYIHSQLGIEPRYVMTDGSVVAGRSQLAEARRNGLMVRGFDDVANFTISLRHHEGNENLVYLVATSKDEGTAKTLDFINLHEFDKMRVQGIKEQYVTRFDEAVRTGQISMADFEPALLEEYEDLGADTIGDQGEDFGGVIDTGRVGGELEVTDFEAITGLTGQADRRRARDSLTQYMEGERNALLDKARQKAQERGINTDAVDEAGDSIFESILDSIGEGISSIFGSDKAEAATVESEPVTVTPSEVSDRTFSDKTVDTTTVQGDTVKSKAVNLIKVQEDFRANPYKDGKNKSVGYGFYIPSLESDEKALIKDINNITEQEANAVIELKVNKITDFMTNEVTGFNSLPDNTQMAITSMAFQLGRQNVRDEWPKFMTAIRKAATLPTNSAQQQKALEEASMHMLFNVKGKTKTATSWSKQTPNRAKEMAEAIKG